MTWTHFWDMHSGGGQKEHFAHCYIEASKKQAELIFQNRFGHNPNCATCTCCGPDYAIDEYETLEEATSFQRNDYENSFKSGDVIPLEAYKHTRGVLFIPASDIAPSEREGTLHQ